MQTSIKMVSNNFEKTHNATKEDLVYWATQSNDLMLKRLSRKRTEKTLWGELAPNSLNTINIINISTFLIILIYIYKNRLEKISRACFCFVQLFCYSAADIPGLTAGNSASLVVEWTVFCKNFGQSINCPLKFFHWSRIWDSKVAHGKLGEGRCRNNGYFSFFCQVLCIGHRIAIKAVWNLDPQIKGPPLA